MAHGLWPPLWQILLVCFLRKPTILGVKLIIGSIDCSVVLDECSDDDPLPEQLDKPKAKVAAPSAATNLIVARDLSLE